MAETGVEIARVVLTVMATAMLIVAVIVTIVIMILAAVRFIGISIDQRYL